MKHALNLIVVFAVLFSAVTPAFAQGTPYIIDSMKPIPVELRGWLNDWLAVDPPSDAPYYIVTYSKDRGVDVVVSLVGVDLASPDEEWSLDDAEKTIWIGTVVVNNSSGEVSPFSPPVTAKKAPGLMSFSLAPGGGSYVAFPFAYGMVAQYGPRGVHGSGDYGTSGMLFVDLVSGDDMGATAAPPYVYAADAGTVDYVCDDGTTVAVRTFNSTSGDYFLYAHLLDNANLEMSHAFGAGELIGSLKYGSFDPPGSNCGWAEQHAKHYHVHWGFVPANGMYQVGSCILTISSQVWQCGDKTVKIGDFLSGGGGFSTPGSSSGTSGAGATVNDPTFFDYVIAGIVTVVSRGIFDLLPSHQPFQYTYMITNIVTMFFRLLWVLVASNISLRWLFIVLLVGFSFKAVMGLAWFGAFLLKTWKSLVPILGA